MRFELGLAVDRRHSGQPHHWYVFEAKPHRELKSLSYPNRTGFCIRDNRPVGIFRCHSPRSRILSLRQT
jgi:hypothetical protein